MDTECVHHVLILFWKVLISQAHILEYWQIKIRDLLQNNSAEGKVARGIGRRWLWVAGWGVSDGYTEIHSIVLLTPNYTNNSFIKIEFTYRKIHPFKEHNSVFFFFVFLVYAGLRNHQHYLIGENVIALERNPYSHSSSLWWTPAPGNHCCCCGCF